MKTVHKSVLIWYSAQEMFDPGDRCRATTRSFFPGATTARYGMVAEMGITFSGIRQVFTTRNEHVAGRSVSLRLLKGPFSRLDGGWHFVPIGDGSQRACRVELRMDYGFDNRASGRRGRAGV
jgi:ribosome-associated toxin RatA of RatAB toxin-antitoxin module